MKAKRTNEVAQMRAEYEFDYSKAVRGKYYERLLKEGSNVVNSRSRRRESLSRLGLRQQGSAVRNEGQASAASNIACNTDTP